MFILLASCASAPKISLPPESEGAELALLPAGGKVYVWADTVQGKPLLDVLSFDGKSSKDAAKVLDLTKTAAGVVFPEAQNKDGQGGQERRFFLAAFGDYPRVKANFSLIFTKGWKKQKSPTGNSYWYSKDQGLALALGPDIALVSNSDPFEDFPKETIPAGFIDFRRGMALAGWLPDSSEKINGFLDAMGLPVQIPAEDFFFGAARLPGKDPSDAPWELIFRIRTESASQARSLLSFINMARLFLLRGIGQEEKSGDGSSMGPMEMAALLFANPPEQDKDALIFRTGPLGEDGIALLFTAFSLYSD